MTRGQITYTEKQPLITCAGCGSSVTLVHGNTEQIELYAQYIGYDIFPRIGWCCSGCQESGRVKELLNGDTGEA